MSFRYLKDPLFLTTFVAYFVNRLLIKRLIHGGFFHTSFNDLICIPFWLPFMLLMMRKCGLRRHDLPPEGLEIVVPLLLWSWFFESVDPKIPYLGANATSDPYDIVWYTVGACISAGFWAWFYRPRDTVIQA